MPSVFIVPTPTLTVRPWADPVIDEVGHQPRSPYVEQFWLGVFGPTATWMLRRLVDGLERAPSGYELDLAVLARGLGLGGQAGQHSPVVRSLQRCCRFGAAELTDASSLKVRRKLPPLTRVQIERLPDDLRAAHERWVLDHSPGTTTGVEHLRNRARHLALSLLELGEDGAATERQLHRWRVHPAMAHDATAWALARHRAAQAGADDRVAEPPPGAA